jgi:hypothetical protein
MFYTTGMCNAERSGNPLETLIQAIQGFVSGSTFELTPAELGDHLIRLRHGIDLLELWQRRRRRRRRNPQGSVTPIDWIRHHCHMSGHAAARAVAAGEQIHRMPTRGSEGLQVLPQCRRRAGRPKAKPHPGQRPRQRSYPSPSFGVAGISVPLCASSRGIQSRVAKTFKNLLDTPLNTPA